MMKEKINKVNAKLESLLQNVTYIQKVRIKEYFPFENQVTVNVIDKGGSFDGLTITTIRDNTPQRFPLGYPGHVSESMPPQPGDMGFLVYTGAQHKTGFVLLGYSPGGHRSSKYIPVRGAWAL